MIFNSIVGSVFLRWMQTVSSLIIVWKFKTKLWITLTNFNIFTKAFQKYLFQVEFKFLTFGVHKKETLKQMFSCEFCEIFKSTFFAEHLWTTASAKWAPGVTWLIQNKNNSSWDSSIRCYKMATYIYKLLFLGVLSWK